MKSLSVSKFVKDCFGVRWLVPGRSFGGDGCCSCDSSGEVGVEWVGLWGL